MAKVERFEDLVAWQKARGLTKEVYRLTAGDRLASDFRFTGQIRGAAVSVMSNIAEGFERGGLPEFQRFLSIAKASAGEVHSLLYVALDAEHIDDAAFQRLMAQTEEVSRIVGGLRAAVERNIASSGRRSIREDEPTPYDLDLE
jgi:four helix bundle protein